MKTHLIILSFFILIIPSVMGAIYDEKRNTLLSVSSNYVVWDAHAHGSEWYDGDFVCASGSTYTQCHLESRLPFFDPMDYFYDNEPTLFNAIKTKNMCHCTQTCPWNPNWCITVHCEQFYRKLRRYNDGEYPFWDSDWYDTPGFWRYGRLSDCRGWPLSQLPEWYWGIWWSGNNPADGHPQGYNTWYNGEISGLSTDSTSIPTDVWQNNWWPQTCEWPFCGKVADGMHVIPDAQEAWGSCVVAGFEMILDYVREHNYLGLSEWDLIQQGHFCQQYDGIFDWCRAGTTMQEFNEALSYYTKCEGQWQGWRPDSDIIQDLAWGNMVPATVCWVTGGCHFIIITGYEFDQYSNLYWYYLDPWHGHQKVSDDWMDLHLNSINPINCAEADVGMFNASFRREPDGNPKTIYLETLHYFGLMNSSYYPRDSPNNCYWDWQNDGTYDVRNADCTLVQSIDTSHETGVITVDSRICGLDGCDGETFSYKVECRPINMTCNDHDQCCSENCEGGRCRESCVPNCPFEGAPDCIGDDQYICDDRDGDGCLEWSLNMTCAGDSWCFFGHCVTGEYVCMDGADNDGDGLIDCDDPDCAGLSGPGGATCCTWDDDCDDCRYCWDNTCRNRGNDSVCSYSYRCSDSDKGDNAYNQPDFRSPSYGYCDGMGNCDYANLTASVCNLAEGASQELAGMSICQDNYGICRSSCSDGIDNDHNNCMDGTDFKCGGTETSCGNHADDDCDGLIDTNDPECHVCTYPDGSSEQCECDSDAECREFGKYCHQVSGWDPCEPIVQGDECSNHGNYFCDGSWIRRCVQQEGRWVVQTIKACQGYGEYCNESIVQGGICATSQWEAWIDYADVGVVVNKQAGDLFKLNVYSSSTHNAHLTYDRLKFNTSCSDNLLLSQGSTLTCDFSVNANATPGRYALVVDGKTAYVQVISWPSMVVVTDAEKLYQRFPDEPFAVKTLLKQAYRLAQGDSVVYDLSMYSFSTPNPFAAWIQYREHMLDPFMEDNAYNVEVSQFIRDRCKECSDVLILGDDYVLPGYRRDIPVLRRDYPFGPEMIDTKAIYTDTPFIKKEGKTFEDFYSMFVLEGRYQGKPVVVIHPHNWTAEMQSRVDELKWALNSRGYYPHFYYKDGKSATCIDYSWFDTLEGHTLIIIGTEADNNAFKCYPFIGPDINRNMVLLQPSMWDSEEYALIFNSDDPDMLVPITKLVENSEIVKLRSNSAYLYKVGITYARYIGLGVSLITLGGFAAGLTAAEIVGVSNALNALTSIAVADNDCRVNYDNQIACGSSLLMAGFGVASPLFKFNGFPQLSDPQLNANLENVFGPFDLLIARTMPAFRRTFIEFGLYHRVIRPAQNIAIAWGVDTFANMIGGDMDTALVRFKQATGLHEETSFRVLEVAGNYSEEFRNNTWLRFNHIEDPRMVYHGSNYCTLTQEDIDRMFSEGGLAEASYNSSLRNLSMHLRGAAYNGYPYGDAFVRLSKSWDVAFVWASIGCYDNRLIFVVRPRGGNLIDSHRMFQLGLIPIGQDEHEYRSYLLSEQEITALDKVSPEDIEKVIVVDADGQEVEQIQNPNYEP
ncbi:MAG: hypothetical protein V1735_04210 [Nanoarchaeota archaeon]